MEAASVSLGHHAHDDHHGPPPANRSSRVEPQLLGMLLFIISEVMVFGAFFTAYFFVRVVQGENWFPFDEHELPKAIAGVRRLDPGARGKLIDFLVEHREVMSYTA